MELSDSLNISKDQLEGAARNIIYDFEKDSGTNNPPPEAAPPQEQPSAEQLSPVNDNWSRPDRTSYL